MGCTLDVLNIDRLLQSVVDNPASPFDRYVPAYFLGPLPEEEYLFSLPQFSRGKIIREQMSTARFRNITTDAFRHFDSCTTGDTCLFYFSGHGSFAPSPPETIHLDNLSQVETLVLQDSRNPGNRDLADKELAYLFWITFHKKPGVNVVIIMDCCNAASNTRTVIKDLPIMVKAMAGAGVMIPFSQMLGHGTDFYFKENGALNHQTIPFIQLSSSQKNEKSIDSNLGGIFTQAFIKILTDTGCQISYRSLINLCNRSIKNRGIEQHPNIYSSNHSGEDNSFLMTNILQPKTFPVFYDGIKKHWLFQAGKIHGLAISKSKKPLIDIRGTGRLATLSKIQENYSIINPDVTKRLDPSKMYEGIPILAGGVIPSFYLSTQLKNTKEKLSPILNEYKSIQNASFDLAITRTGADFILLLDKDNHYYCTRTNKNMPLFPSLDDPKTLMDYLRIIGHWKKYQSLNHISSHYTTEQFDFSCTYAVLPIDKADGNLVHKSIQINEENYFSLDPDEKAVWSLKIMPSEKATFDQCYVSCIYFTQNFEVITHLVPLDSSILKKGESLSIPDPSSVLALYFRDREKLDVPTVSMKVIVSGFPVDISLLESKGLSITQQSVTRSHSVEQQEWAVFNFFFDFKKK